MRLVLFVVLIFSAPASADYFDGNTLKRLLDSSREFDEAMYRGYVAGVQDSYNGVLFCVHEKVLLSQAYSVVKKYLENNPKDWHKAAKTLVIDALSEAFPCKK